MGAGTAWEWSPVLQTGFQAGSSPLFRAINIVLLSFEFNSLETKTFMPVELEQSERRSEKP